MLHKSYVEVIYPAYGTDTKKCCIVYLNAWQNYISPILGGREGTLRDMERYRTMRAYSAGGVVFRLAPLHTMPPVSRILSAGKSISGEQQNEDKLNSIEPEQESMLDGEAQGMEVVLVGRSHAGIWALPKGTPKPGETIEQVAVREVQEETGLQVRIIAYIGSISYTFVRTQVRYHKQVRHFLMEPIGGDIALHDHEYDLVAWFPLAEACRRLTYQNEVNILYQAEETLQRWLQHRRREG